MSAVCESVNVCLGSVLGLVVLCCAVAGRQKGPVCVKNYRYHKSVFHKNHCLSNPNSKK